MSRVAPWHEGLARENEPSEPQKWAWVLGALGLGIGGTLAERWDQSTLWTVGGLAVAIVAGAAWQLVYRRDLADRLELLSWLLLASVVLVGVLSLLPGVDDDPGATEVSRFVAGVGVVAGLVLTEQCLRRRDRA